MDVATDLRWYFCDSASACGLRSPLGRQLEQMRSGVVPVRCGVEPWVRPSDVERAARIRDRLLACTALTRKTLELQYCSPTLVAGVSLHLAAAQSCAEQLFVAASRKVSSLTRPQWILWLAQRAALGNRREREVLEKICDSANRELECALWEYNAK